METDTRAIILELTEKLSHEYKPLKIILYGSYSDGTQDKDSDIDLLIIKDTSAKQIQRRIRIREIIANPLRTIPVDTIVLTPRELQRRLSTGDQFIHEIIRKGKVLYESD